MSPTTAPSFEALTQLVNSADFSIDRLDMPDRERLDLWGLVERTIRCSLPISDDYLTGDAKSSNTSVAIARYVLSIPGKALITRHRVKNGRQRFFACLLSGSRGQSSKQWELKRQIEFNLLLDAVEHMRQIGVVWHDNENRKWCCEPEESQELTASVPLLSLATT